LQESGDSQGTMMAEQLRKMMLLERGKTPGDMLRQTDALAQIDKQGDLAFQFARLKELDPEKRIRDLDLEQRIALAETSGMSRGQLDALMRIEDSLRVQYDQQKKSGESFIQWLSRADLSQVSEADIAATEATAEDYMRSIAENTASWTESLTAYLKDLLMIVTDIRDMIGSSSFFGGNKTVPIDPENPLKQAEIRTSGKPVVHDFISRPGMPVQRFTSADTVIGMKQGGPIDAVLGQGTGSTVVNIHIHDDQAQTDRTVRDAIKASRQ
jgi:hypothetical protein